MAAQDMIRQQARALSREARKGILMSFKEVDLHPLLKSLLSEMDPDSLVEITHGHDEYGKDLVMVKDDPFGRTVTAIVVKTGDIRAKTLGKIDQVKSQVDQATTHPARLRAIAGPLPVSAVWVVLAGELSNQAHTRLREVSAPDLRVYDLNWLVESFTEYYPQVFFEGRVMDILQDKIQDLETKHMFCERGWTLSECFVNPLVAAVGVPMSFDEATSALISISRKRKLPFSRLGSLLWSKKRIILVGDPGTGKSVALAKLAVDMLRAASERLVSGETRGRTLEIPLLVRAMELLDPDDCEGLVRELIPQAEVRDRFRLSVLMIDGLDEAPAERREEILQRASDFATQLHCSLIITARKIDLIKSIPSGFSKYELLPFEFSQALALFERVVTDSQVLEALKSGLDRIKLQMPLTPLSLLLLVQLAEDHREIPASLTELYDRFCDMILGRYDKDRGIEVLFDYLVKKRFLAVLAYKEFFEKDRLAIPSDDLDRFLEEYADIYGWDPEGLRHFTSEMERASILSVKQTVTFRHRSFLDYFVAQYIHENRETFENLEDRIVRMYFDDV